MDSLNSILGNKEFNEPEIIEKLKQYIQLTYNSRSTIKVGPKGVTIIVSSSALANTLRLNMPDIKRRLAIKDRFNIRIG